MLSLHARGLANINSVRAILDANRNSLMLLDLRFSIITLAITAGTFVAALYGMNLKNYIEESDLGFFGISAWCTVFGAFVGVYCLAKLRRVQRVKMRGQPGSEWGGIRPNVWGNRALRAPNCDGQPSLRERHLDSLTEVVEREKAAKLEEMFDKQRSRDPPNL